ncbi:MAG: hypothetical protein KGJ57_17405 [Sphingomonadales bacterium]|nr:hypothetical protein [Sphingomonadales bacterium]MDE2171175.1 hypothetical protein [Sphingomonadales bacterium]
MTNPRDIVLGGKTFSVPPLPLRISKVASPLLRRLSRPTDPGKPESSFAARVLAANGSVLAVEDAENADLIEIAWLAASAADRTLTRDQFEDLPITGMDLINAFFAMRWQSGEWIAPEDAKGESPAQGEAQAA